MIYRGTKKQIKAAEIATKRLIQKAKDEDARALGRTTTEMSQQSAFGGSYPPKVRYQIAADNRDQFPRPVNDRAAGLQTALSTSSTSFQHQGSGAGPPGPWREDHLRQGSGGASNNPYGMPPGASGPMMGGPMGGPPGPHPWGTGPSGPPLKPTSSLLDRGSGSHTMLDRGHSGTSDPAQRSGGNLTGSLYDTVVQKPRWAQDEYPEYPVAQMLFWREAMKKMGVLFDPPRYEVRERPAAPKPPRTPKQARKIDTGILLDNAPEEKETLQQIPHAPNIQDGRVEQQQDLRADGAV